MRRLRAALAVAVLSCLIAFGLDVLGVVERLELLSIDARYASGIGRRAPGEDLVIAWIDQESLEFVAGQGMGFPWPRTLYEEVLGYLRECGAKAVGFDLLFDQPSSTDTDTAFGEALAARADNALVVKLVEFREGAASPEATQRFAARALQGQAAPRDLAVARGVVLPLPEIERGATRLGFSNVAADADKTHRHYELVRGLARPGAEAPWLQPSFALATALVARPELDLAGSLAGPARRLLNFRGPEFSFDKVKFVNIVQSMMASAEGQTPLYGKERFEGKIVLVGIHADGLEDAHPTPLSRSFPGVELHATAIDNLQRGDWLRESGWQGAFAAAAAALATTAVFALPGVIVPLSVLLGIAVLFLASALLAWQSLLVLPIAMPALAYGSSAGLGLAWRLVVEGRQKREMRRAFASYLAPEVLSEVLRDPDAVALGGSAREVTLFFTDLAGFTGLAEHVSPTELVAFLNDYFTRMCEPVLAERGVIDKFIGDAIMALFGAPLPGEDHPLRAVRAALVARRVSEDIAAELRQAGKPSIETRIGVHTGLAVVGNMGSSKRFDYTAIGDTVNLASRLEGANKAFGTGILVSETTWARCAGEVLGREVGRLAVKGRSEPLVVYEPLALRGAATDDEVGAVAAHAAAIDAARRGDRDAARAAFARLAALRPHDALVALWHARLGESDWDGVFRLDVK